MVKFVQCVTRKPGMTAIDFRMRWNEYGKKLEELVRASPNVVRYRLSSTLLVRATISWMIEYGASAPYDGMVEIWLADANLTATNLRENETAKAEVGKLIDMLHEFVDREKSTAFYAAEDLEYDAAA